MMRKSLIFLILFCLFLTACSGQNTTGSVDSSIVPAEGQPKFPNIGKYWVIDTAGLISQETLEYATEALEQLKQDGIAEVAIVVQKDIVNRGPLNDEKIWALSWGRYVKLGDKENRRAIVWLIRPDVKPEDNRITIEISTTLTWLTPIDYGPIMEEAAEYANYDDFNGAVESLVRNTDEVLRKIWKEKNESGGN